MTDGQADPILDVPWDQSAVVIAGPGCGKSFKIGARAKKFVDDGDVSRDDIAIVSLTRSTVRALRRDVEEGEVSTLHAFALRALNRMGDAAHKKVVDEWEQDKLVAPDLCILMTEARVTPTVVGNFLKRLGTGFRENQEDPPNLSPIEMALRERWLMLRSFMEFRLYDELAFDLLRHLESGAELPSPPKVIMADEYQDLTPCELALLRAINERHSTAIFACGDDRQAIFGFRDADPLGLNNFCRVYELDEPIYLTESWRCPQVVCQLAEAIASRMPPVAGLAQRPALEAHPSVQAGHIDITSYPSPIRECRETHGKIAALLQDDVPSTDIMVIAPYNLGLYVKMLNDCAAQETPHISYYDTRATAKVANSREFRALYAFSRIGSDNNDHLAWRTLIWLAHGYGGTFVGRILNATATSFAASLRGIGALDEHADRFITAAQETLDRMRTADSWEEIVAAVDAWLERSGARAIRDWDGVRDLGEWLAIEESPVPSGDETAARFSIIASALLEAASTRRGDVPPGENEIPVYTVFQAKGLQAERVFLMAAFTDAFLGDNRHPADGMRRLYVAVTRARNWLSITVGRYVRNRDYPLHHGLGVYAVDLTPHVIECANQVGISVDIVQ